jgi:hypothetical protein
MVFVYCEDKVLPKVYKIIFMIFRLLCIFITTDNFHDEIDFYAQTVNAGFLGSYPPFSTRTKERS